MRVLLIQPRFTLAPDIPLVVQIPLGLCYLAGAARAQGHELGILDCLAEGWRRRVRGPKGDSYGLSDDAIEARLRAFQPDVVGISVPFSIQAGNALDLARLVARCCPDARVVLGGMHATALPREVLEEPAVHFVIQGEGEESFPRLLAALEGRGSPDEVDGLAYRRSDGSVVVHPKRCFVEDLDRLPLPAWDLVELSSYRKAGRAHGFAQRGRRNFPVVSSRGCPARCVFCGNHRLWGRGFRARSPEHIVAELEHLVRAHGVDHIQFEDDNLTYDIPRAKALFRLMIERVPGLRWTTPNGVALWSLDRECLELMHRAGCYFVCFGLESGSQRVLSELMGKPLDLDRVLPLIPYARSLGMRVGLFFVVGLPGETREELQASFELPYRVPVDWVEYSIASPYPGTALRRLASDGQLLREPGIEGVYARRGVIDTPAFSADWLERKVRLENRRLIRHMLLRRPRTAVSQGWEMFRGNPRFVASWVARTFRSAD
jgi:anaerobic magnesium-protoporphyrin IX monomethyl ester cyclase